MIRTKLQFGSVARCTTALAAVLVLAGSLIAPAFTFGALGGSQSTLGTITGIITEAVGNGTAGPVLPGVTVKLKNEDIGSTLQTLTNDSGNFTFLVPPGTNYTVTAELQNFKKAVLRQVSVRIGDTTRIALRMELGAIDQSVIVKVDPRTSLHADTLNTGNAFGEEEIAKLPLAGGDPLMLIGTLPGYRANPQGHQFDIIGGLPMTMINTVRDGLSVTDGPTLTASTVVPTDPRAALPRYAADREPDRLPAPPPNTEAYDAIVDNPFVSVANAPMATFSSDVDTASYANVRRFLTHSQAPPRDAVRIEEMINYFSYDYPKATGSQPITANIEVASAPWNPKNRLVRIGIKSKEVQMGQKASNLVFLIDVSGSMASQERLPLVKSGLKMLVDRLTESDRVSIVTYAGYTGVALKPTNGSQKEVILRAIDGLAAGGGTNGGAGIQLAYEQAVLHFVEGGVNRVILATDGDFNVGITNRNDLLQLIADKAKSGVFLTALGFGMGNYKDSTLELLADKGNGMYAYIDTLNEARKVLVEEIGGTLVTVAKDVKIQVEFNPAQVAGYRLIGYENRVLRTEDFADDRKDAGDMGAGHTVTALFEVVPRGAESASLSLGPRYEANAKPVSAKAPDNPFSKELLDLRIRYKEPDGTASALIEFPVVDRGGAFAKASSDFRFAASVAAFGMILRNSPHRGSASVNEVIRMAKDSKGTDKQGYREEFIQLAQRAAQLGLR